jgi:hypothetical protein
MGSAQTTILGMNNTTSGAGAHGSDTYPLPELRIWGMRSTSIVERR